MFERIYHHPLHNPGLFWLVGLPLCVFFARQLAKAPTGERRGFVIVALAFQLVILLDAALQGELSPLSGALQAGSGIVFVILGDLRFFLLLERFGRQPKGSWLVPLALALLVPVASSLLRPLLPPEPRYLFLAYELMFVVLTLALRFVVLPRRGTGPRAFWARRLASFVLAQYGLWALADVVILAGVDAGYLLRVVPNAMYYAAFLLFAWRTAPSSLRP